MDVALESRENHAVFVGEVTYEYTRSFASFVEPFLFNKSERQSIYGLALCCQISIAINISSYHSVTVPNTHREGTHATRHHPHTHTHTRARVTHTHNTCKATRSE